MKWDANWTPAGARWYDWVLTVGVLVLAMPIWIPKRIYWEIFHPEKNDP